MGTLTAALNEIHKYNEVHDHSHLREHPKGIAAHWSHVDWRDHPAHVCLTSSMYDTKYVLSQKPPGAAGISHSKFRDSEGLRGTSFAL
mmetsp:Transcript_43656/g.102661  ORF Transcript_43656/g.102661 Transcript_43656/m.102661 type:complete len:88 (-) Transcript_43656:18-281(-)